MIHKNEIFSLKTDHQQKLQKANVGTFLTTPYVGMHFIHIYILPTVCVKPLE